jgi:hypothetical protein
MNASLEIMSNEEGFLHCTWYWNAVRTTCTVCRTVFMVHGTVQYKESIARTTLGVLPVLLETMTRATCDLRCWYLYPHTTKKHRSL